MQFRHVLRHIFELPIDRCAAFICAQGQITFQAHTPGCQLTCSGDGGFVVAIFTTVGLPSFLRRSKGIKSLVGPVVQHVFKHGFDLLGREIFENVNARFFHGSVEGAGL